MERAFIKDPAFKIDLQHEIITASKDKKNKSIMPSAMAIYSLTNGFFITDRPKANLLIMDSQDLLKSLRS